jgi:murein DD-endopeptidase MepM/ murein hydrolase activator NlpD
VSLEQNLKPALARLAALAGQHRLGIIGTAVAVLSGFAVTAVAIAPLAPDASELPRRVVTEAVEPLDIGVQLDALNAQDLTLRRSDLTRAADTADALFKRLGITDIVAAHYLRTDPIARMLFTGRGGKMVQAVLRDDGKLVSLVARYPSDRSEESRSHFKRLELSWVDNRWIAQIRTVAYGMKPVMAGGTIKSSLFAATDDAQVPDVVAAQLADIFAGDIDFHRELRKGDSFNIVYEALTADGEPVPWNEGAGRVLAAEFITAGRAHHAVWFTPADGRGGYFGLDGQSRSRSFLASPVEFSRITSGFANRFHPIQNSWRQHLGVDYSAPTGTPVRSVGEGVVEFAGWQNGYGNVIEIRHARNRETLYAHLSRIDVAKGERIQQGQHIGAVGSTGWSTGPHLHFEFRIDGEHHDPLQVAKSGDSLVLDDVSRQRFTETVGTIRTKLDLAATVAAAGAKATVE